MKEKKHTPILLINLFYSEAELAGSWAIHIWLSIFLYRPHWISKFFIWFPKQKNFSIFLRRTYDTLCTWVYLKHAFINISLKHFILLNLCFKIFWEVCYIVGYKIKDKPDLKGCQIHVFISSQKYGIM
jgi:hypothetical protein